MSDSLNFGPDWMRTLTGSAAPRSDASRSNARANAGAPAPPAPKSGSLHYNREQMLELFNKDTPAPLNLDNFPTIFSRRTLPPMATIAFTEEEQLKNLELPINSQATRAPTTGPATASRGRGLAGRTGSTGGGSGASGGEWQTVGDGPGARRSSSTAGAGWQTVSHSRRSVDVDPEDDAQDGDEPPWPGYRRDPDNPNIFIGPDGQRRLHMRRGSSSAGPRSAPTGSSNNPSTAPSTSAPGVTAGRRVSSSNDAKDWRRGPPRVSSDTARVDNRTDGRKDEGSAHEPAPEWAEEDEALAGSSEDAGVGMFDKSGNFVASAKTDLEKSLPEGALRSVPQEAQPAVVGPAPGSRLHSWQQGGQKPAWSEAAKGAQSGLQGDNGGSAVGPSSSAPLAGAPPRAMSWFYKDPSGQIQGPFTHSDMSEWLNAGFFDGNLLVRREDKPDFVPLGSLTALAANPFLPSLAFESVPSWRPAAAPLSGGPVLNGLLDETAQKQVPADAKGAAEAQLAFAGAFAQQPQPQPHQLQQGPQQVDVAPNVTEINSTIAMKEQQLAQFQQQFMHAQRQYQHNTQVFQQRVQVIGHQRNHLLLQDQSNPQIRQQLVFVDRELQAFQMQSFQLRQSEQDLIRMQQELQQQLAQLQLAQQQRQQLFQQQALLQQQQQQQQQLHLQLQQNKHSLASGALGAPTPISAQAARTHAPPQQTDQTQLLHLLNHMGQGAPLGQQAVTQESRILGLVSAGETPQSAPAPVSQESKEKTPWPIKKTAEQPAKTSAPVAPISSQSAVPVPIPATSSAPAPTSAPTPASAPLPAIATGAADVRRKNLLEIQREEEDEKRRADERLQKERNERALAEAVVNAARNQEAQKAQAGMWGSTVAPAAQKKISLREIQEQEAKQAGAIQRGDKVVTPAKQAPRWAAAASTGIISTGEQVWTPAVEPPKASLAQIQAEEKKRIDAAAAAAAAAAAQQAAIPHVQPTAAQLAAAHVAANKPRSLLEIQQEEERSRKQPQQQQQQGIPQQQQQHQQQGGAVWGAPTAKTWGAQKGPSAPTTPVKVAAATSPVSPAAASASSPKKAAPAVQQQQQQQQQQSAARPAANSKSVSPKEAALPLPSSTGGAGAVADDETFWDYGEGAKTSASSDAASGKGKKGKKAAGGSGSSAKAASLEPSSELITWCEKQLRDVNETIDVATFVTFLMEIESASDVAEYVAGYLSSPSAAKAFAEGFVFRRNTHRMGDSVGTGEPPGPADIASSDWQTGKNKKGKK